MLTVLHSVFYCQYSFFPCLLRFFETPHCIFIFIIFSARLLICLHFCFQIIFSPCLIPSPSLKRKTHIPVHCHFLSLSKLSLSLSDFLQFNVCTCTYSFLPLLPHHLYLCCEAQHAVDTWVSFRFSTLKMIIIIIKFSHWIQKT